MGWQEESKDKDGKKTRADSKSRGGMRRDKVRRRPRGSAGAAHYC